MAVDGGYGGMAAAPTAGWYLDARGAMRWWDGAGWTEHVREAAAAPPATARPAVPVSVFVAAPASVPVPVAPSAEVPDATALLPTARTAAAAPPAPARPGAAAMAVGGVVAVADAGWSAVKVIVGTVAVLLFVGGIVRSQSDEFKVRCAAQQVGYDNLSLPDKAICFTQFHLGSD